MAAIYFASPAEFRKWLAAHHATQTHLLVGFQLDETYAKMLRRNAAAWAFFQAQPPSYRKLANWWVTSAKKEETRARRLARLIADSAAGKRI